MRPSISALPPTPPRPIIDFRQATPQAKAGTQD
jgi:hypothetical protein